MYKPLDAPKILLEHCNLQVRKEAMTPADPLTIRSSFAHTSLLALVLLLQKGHAATAATGREAGVVEGPGRAEIPKVSWKWIAGERKRKETLGGGTEDQLL